MIQAPYAWPSFDAASEQIAEAVDGILAASFNQSSTKIKDREAVLSAARHIVQTDRLEIALETNAESSFPGLVRASGAVKPPYAWPSPSITEENKAAVIYQVIRDSFKQSSTKVKDDQAILSAARHLAQSSKFKIALATQG